MACCPCFPHWIEWRLLSRQLPGSSFTHLAACPAKHLALFRWPESKHKQWSCLILTHIPDPAKFSCPVQCYSQRGPDVANNYLPKYLHHQVLKLSFFTINLTVAELNCSLPLCFQTILSLWNISSFKEKPMGCCIQNRRASASVQFIQRLKISKTNKKTNKKTWQYCF